MSKISIIIPVYNAEATIKQCVDSILSQDYQDFELLLIDDGSKDLSADICDKYAKQDARIKVYHKENGGVSSARNMGLEKAKGEWITFIDSDDYIEPGYFEDFAIENTSLYIKAHKSFRGNDTALYTICSFEAKKLLTGEELRLFIKKNVSGFIFRGPVGKFYKKENIDSLRFQEDMIVAEDACFVMNYLSSIDNLCVLPNGAYVVRLGPVLADAKYKVTISNAIQSLKYLQEAYLKVDHKFRIGHYGFLSFIGSFKRMSRDEWINKPSKWYGNTVIKNMYRYVWPDLSWQQKIKLIGAFILRR